MIRIPINTRVTLKECLYECRSDSNGVIICKKVDANGIITEIVDFSNSWSYTILLDNGTKLVTNCKRQDDEIIVLTPIIRNNKINDILDV
jgi:hypothetical protein